MIFHRLLAWFRPSHSVASPIVVPVTKSSTVIEPATCHRAAALELAEFGRLLASGNSDDLKKIAKAMTQLDRFA